MEKNYRKKNVFNEDNLQQIYMQYALCIQGYKTTSHQHPNPICDRPLCNIMMDMHGRLLLLLYVGRMQIYIYIPFMVLILVVNSEYAAHIYGLSEEFLTKSDSYL